MKVQVSMKHQDEFKRSVVIYARGHIRIIGTEAGFGATWEGNVEVYERHTKYLSFLHPNPHGAAQTLSALIFRGN